MKRRRSQRAPSGASIHLNRRQVLAGLGALGGLAMMPGRAQAQGPVDRRFLIVVAGAGGASIIDSFLAVRGSESANAAGLNTFPDQLVTGFDDSPLRAVDMPLNSVGPLPFEGSTMQAEFVRRHQQDMQVVTWTGTSVTHQIGQKRSLTGNDAWAGRTLQEIIADTYGRDLPMPNVNMGFSGYLEPGIDASLPERARHEVVSNALLWPLGLDGVQGVRGAPARDLVARARQMRNQQLDAESTFARTFGGSAALSRWMDQRTSRLEQLEAGRFIEKLNLLEHSQAFPIDDFGLVASPDAARLREVFPRAAIDPFEAQGALAFLLLKNNVSNTVTLSPGFSPLVEVDGGVQVESAPLAFDFSHNAHRATQAQMWSRLLSVIDRLIGLLKAEELGNGVSYWDRSMVYVATEFGRTRTRPEGSFEFASGHHLNNGSLIVSPMSKGNTVLGGVDPDTALTYGFDPATGAPDPGRNMAESHVFAGILQTLGIDTGPAGLPDMRAMRRG